MAEFTALGPGLRRGTLAEFLCASYLLGMAILPRPVSPRAAWRDLIGFLRERRRHELIFAALAIFFPAMIILGFYVDSKVEIPWEAPDVVYVTQWPADRSREVIAAQQAIDLPKQIAERKRIEGLKAEKRRQFQRVDKKLDDMGF